MHYRAGTRSPTPRPDAGPFGLCLTPHVSQVRKGVSRSSRMHYRAGTRFPTPRADAAF